MSVAGDMAQANAEKEKFCKELEEKHLEKKGIEKRIEWLKSKLDPMMKVGERIGLVEKLEVKKLNVGGELLEELEKELGSGVVRRECNVKNLRAALAEKPDRLNALPHKKSTQIRVGEKWGS